MLRQKILKTQCLRLAKNAFSTQHLLHHSIIYTFMHYPTNFVLLRWACISEVIPAVQVAFFLLVRVFPLNLSLYLNFYNYIFLSWGNIFWELKKFSGTNGPVVRYFFHPCETVWIYYGFNGTIIIANLIVWISHFFPVLSMFLSWLVGSCVYHDGWTCTFVVRDNYKFMLDYSVSV